MNSKSQAILVIGPSWVGDMVMAQSLFMTLKQKTPEAEIDVLAPAWSKPLLQRMPEVTDAIEMPLGHGQFDIKTRFQLGQQLRNHNYQHVFVLPNSWKSALIPFFSQIPVRTGYKGEMRWGLLNDIHYLDKKQLSMTVQRFVALADKNTAIKQLYPAPKLNISSLDQQQAQEKFQLNQTKKILALCPGAEYGPAKCWPAEHYAALAIMKLAQGWQVWLFGSEKDQTTSNQINQLTSNQCIDLSGKTTLAEAVDLMSIVDAVVSNDSGLMHVAAALDKRLIALYGSSDPNFTPPLNEQATVLSLGLDCSPCFKRKCPLQHLNCLQQIIPEQVAAELEPSQL